MANIEHAEKLCKKYDNDDTGQGVILKVNIHPYSSLVRPTN